MELNEKLLRCVGFELKTVQCVGLVYYETEQQCWYYNGREYGLTPPGFTKSLDACFKWLMPRLVETIDVFPLNDSKAHRQLATAELLAKCVSDSILFEKETAMEICLAIEKLIEVNNGTRKN